MVGGINSRMVLAYLSVRDNYFLFPFSPLFLGFFFLLAFLSCFFSTSFFPLLEMTSCYKLHEML